MKKIFLLYHYLAYRLKAVNEHGVHSPFVFDLLTNIIYAQTDYYPFKKIEKLREELLDSKELIEVNDLGTGSSNRKNTVKKVKELVKYSAKSPKYAQLLFRLVNHFQPSQIIELGTSVGLSSAYLASANSKTKVITIEGCEEIAKIAKHNFKQLKLKNIEQVIGNFDDVLPIIINKCQILDFVFFDGNHHKQATINYFNLCLEKANDGTVFVFDDIYWSAEMIAAWTEIKNNTKVTVTLDLFFMGIVFFRKEQVKQHFMINF